jgi:hypothetical protein
MTMTWIDELRDEMRRRQAEELSGLEIETRERADEDTAYAGRLVRSLLEQMNRELLEGRGSVWETQIAWGARLWELWWGPTRIEGRYIFVTLLRDSGGTPYLKLNRIRLALRDPRLERRLQRALQSAFLEPRVYTPREPAAAGTQNAQRSA